jgi:flagellar basal-body rod protein FlgB
MMAGFSITDRTISVLQKSLDLRSQKQEVIASNIANAETPGYSARKMSFEEDLRQALESPQIGTHSKSHPKHFPIGGTSIQAVQGTIEKELESSPLGDGNNVSVDEEMFDLAENQLLYEAGAQILKKKLTLLKYAASNGS